ncbi:hypothetical protein BpHYR1_005949 [Brachionus plicatilis]|uniref:Uncharacterized protein n=1 Tax=Brachionus plicatilis TaxID=10195 RepID=A0A3M7SR07_BRAPC|nr:hypothetical protein BpHYR1_005949 [Brachionus plicatilis]
MSFGVQTLLYLKNKAASVHLESNEVLLVASGVGGPAALLMAVYGTVVEEHALAVGGDELEGER